MNKIRICGAIASATGVTLFLENGEQMVLAKDSHRTGEIVREAMPYLAKHQIAEIDLDAYTAHSILEKKSGGLLRFITEKVKGVFTGRVDAVVYGKVIPNVQRLEKHIERAAYGESYAGFEVFMKRLAAIIDTRGHTVDELLNFMEKGDLPIADDGSIVAYKVLKTSGVNDLWVDCHTGKVTQKLGSFVSMPLKDVDENRRQECSTGLHVARRGYLSGFSGNVMTLIKVAPEDVVAVPKGEPNKMRVRAYHIVADLSNKAAELLRSGKPMTSDEASAKTLAAVIAGDHIGILEEVSITKEYGEGVRVTILDPDGVPVTPKDHAPMQALDEQVEQKNAVPISEIQKTVRAAAAEAKINAAAISGDMSAALSVEPENKPAETAPVAEVSAPKKKRKAPVAPAPAPVAVDPVQKPLKPFSELPEKHREALSLIKDGLSQREVEKQVNICRKTLRKLIKAGYKAE